MVDSVSNELKSSNSRSLRFFKEHGKEIWRFLLPTWHVTTISQISHIRKSTQPLKKGQIILSPLYLSSVFQSPPICIEQSNVPLYLCKISKLPSTSNFMLTLLTPMKNWLNYPHGHIEMSIMSFITHKLLKKKSEFKEHSEFRIDQILI